MVGNRELGKLLISESVWGLALSFGIYKGRRGVEGANSQGSLIFARRLVTKCSGD